MEATLKNNNLTTNVESKNRKAIAKAIKKTKSLKNLQDLRKLFSNLSIKEVSPVWLELLFKGCLKNPNIGKDPEAVKLIAECYVRTGCSIKKPYVLEGYILNKKGKPLRLRRIQTYLYELTEERLNDADGLFEK